MATPPEPLPKDRHARGAALIGLLRRRRAFKRVLAAHAASRAGDAFNAVALVVLVFELTGSGIGVAATVGFEIVPVLALGPVAGVLVDRFPRRDVMIGADLARTGLAAALAMWHGSVALAYATAFGLAVGAVAFNPASAALVPDLVDDDELVDANSALWTVAVALQIVLAPVAGLLVATYGPGPAFAVNAGSYVVSAAALAGLDAGRTPADTQPEGWKTVGYGLKVVGDDRLLRRLVAAQALAALSAGATSALLVVLAGDRLGVGPSGFGALLAAIGVGATAGPLLARRRIRAADRRWLFGPFVVRGGVDATLATVTNPIVAGGALAVYGMATSTGMVTYQTTVQAVVAPAARGRVFAVFDVTWNAARLGSLALGGILADAVGIRLVYLLGAALLLLAAAVGSRAPALAGREQPSVAR